MEQSQDRDTHSTSDASATPSSAAESNHPRNHPEVDPTSIRGALGNGMDRFSLLVNNNLIAARYGIFSAVTLLTVYGLSQTPLFFRYRTVADVPASSFMTRRRLYGRIIAVDTVESGDIQIQVRHLSPIGQILPKSWFDFLVKFSPQASRLGTVTSTTAKPEENARDLLKVKIAGIHPPPISRLVYKPEQFLDRLAKERVLVTCQLVARQVHETIPMERSNAEKRPMSQVMPEFAVIHTDTTSSTVDKTNSLVLHRDHHDEVAICRVTYRPKVFQFFPTDVAESLIATGNASVSTTILGRDVSTFKTTGTSIKDTSQRLQDLRNDVKYLDRLAKVEFEAARQSIGMWSVPEVRESKREVVEEVEFQTKASTIQKLWRWVRGG